MDKRRDFLKKAFLLAGIAGAEYSVPSALKKAMAIEPPPGSTYMDAEHVVILMQENRAFDHAFGTLQGVRGFEDPRFVRQQNGLPIWFQPDSKENFYSPFHFGLMNTKSSWMGAVPHSRHSQVDAFKDGWHNGWIDAKKVGNKNFSHIPLTMGYYNRQDVPFNYALADAFTICDQNFCSAMSSTWPNRFFFWTGTLRREQNAKAKAELRNELGVGVGEWNTFPEVLEDAGVPWKIYQNDLSAGGGFKKEERSWLANFGCNPLERFKNYNVRFSDRYVNSLKTRFETVSKEAEELRKELKKTDLSSKKQNKIEKDLQKKKQVIEEARKELTQWTEENFNRLSQKEKNLYNKAFSTNKEDPNFRELAKLEYTDDKGEKRKMEVPKGDILHEFRQDVKKGKLPSVSWLVPAQRYSDHPSSPWYGSWYISEIIDILTENPEVWKKTIFIMTYDENDGYYDHVPPFVPPNPQKKKSGVSSKGIDNEIEYVTKEEEIEEGRSKGTARSGPIGLGFRVPMIVASPWSKGGKVCSEVFDHTSTLQFLEHFLSNKFNKKIHMDQISAWRRTICGDLTSVFSDGKTQKNLRKKLPFIERNEYLENIHQSRYKGLPKGFEPRTKNEIEQNEFPYKNLLPKQEKGQRASCILPYELYVDGKVFPQKNQIHLELMADNSVFGKKSKGAPFTVYFNDQIRSYAVKAGDKVSDEFEFGNDKSYDLDIHGPNGFYRRFKNSGENPELTTSLTYEKQGNAYTGKVMLSLQNTGNEPIHLKIQDKAYGKEPIEMEIKPKTERKRTIDFKDSHYWYDFDIILEKYKNYLWSYAGRIEVGKMGYTDPQIGS